MRLSTATQPASGQAHSHALLEMVALAQVSASFISARHLSLIRRRNTMRVRPHLARYLAPLPLVFTLVLAACSSAAATNGRGTATTGGSHGGGSPTPTPAPCATK